MGMPLVKYWAHIDSIQDILLQYANIEHISSTMMEQMLATLLCTCAIRNNKDIEQLTEAVENEFETCADAWEKIQAERKNTQ